MRIERGPFGRIAVNTVASEADVVLHALDVLQNHVISSILPVYIREQLGKVQLCIDCTGYMQLSEARLHEWQTPLLKRKCVADFLQTIIDAQDHFMDSSLFVMDPEYIFFDAGCNKLYWCCLPVVERCTQMNPDIISRTWKEFELVLMDPFFSDVLEEDDRNQVLCFFRDGCEDDIKQFLACFLSPAEQDSKRASKGGRRYVRLLIQFFMMTACFAACIFLEKQPVGIISGGSWAGWYVIVFTLFLIINLMLGQGNKSKPNHSAQSVEAENAKSLSRKELYFPTCTDSDSVYEANSSTPLFSPAFLTQQITHSAKETAPVRALVWVDDFLIGRDKSICDLFLDHTSISDRHARIIHRGSMYFLVDLGSAAGTWIGSRRLYSYEESPLMDKDTVLCGDLRFIFSLPDQSKLL